MQLESEKPTIRGRLLSEISYTSSSCCLASPLILVLVSYCCVSKYHKFTSDSAQICLDPALISNPSLSHSNLYNRYLRRISGVSQCCLLVQLLLKQELIFIISFFHKHPFQVPLVLGQYFSCSRLLVTSRVSSLRDLNPQLPYLFGAMVTAISFLLQPKYGNAVSSRQTIPTLCTTPPNDNQR